MSKTWDGIGEELARWLGRQHVFFTATAPLAGDGHVNCSPKGGDSFRVLGPQEVAYLDYTGSGAETAAHLRENGRIVLMFCAFDGPPEIANHSQWGLPEWVGRIAGVALACALCGLFSFTPGQAFPPTPAQVAIARAELAKDNRWFNAPWDSNDQPYASIRQSIDRQAVSGEKAVALMRGYDVEVKQNPDYLPGLFADAYAAYWAAVLPGGIGAAETMQRMSNAELILDRYSPPHTYNFVRLIYLCQMVGWADPQLKSVGIRLVRADPKDYEVTFSTVVLLETSPLPKERALALTFAQDLARRYPAKPNAHELLGSVHYQDWLKTKDPKEVTLALAGYQRYLQLAPPTYKYYKQTQELVAQLEKAQGQS